MSPSKRLRQHNGELAGGARRTRGICDWRFQCVVSGFRTWQEALQFEWAFKYHSRGCRGVDSRTRALTELMKRERWTSNAPLASEVPLVVEYEPTSYGTCAVAASESSAAAPSAAAPSVAANRVPARRRRKWKKTLRGVAY